MKTGHIKTIILSAMLLFCISVTTVYAKVTQEDINNAQNQVNQLQQQVQDAENTLDEINDKKDALEDDLNDFNNDLTSLVNDLNVLEDKISVKQDEISAATTDLERAEAQVAKQYEDMKRRIQYMYENGSSSTMSAIFGSNSFAELINQSEKVSMLVEYDRQKLLEYQDLQAQIEAQKAQLEKEKAEFHALQDEKGKKKDQVTTMIAATEQNIAQTNTEINNTQSTIDNLEAQIAYWEKVEAELEAQKLAQDLALWEQIQQAGKEDWSGVTYTPADGELYLLGAIIQCESDGEPYEGKIAVGSVIMNRVKSSKFPNSITEVVYQNKQFAPVASGRLNYRLQAGVNATCMQAATEVLNGRSNTDALFFRTVIPGINGMVIGNHIFY